MDSSQRQKGAEELADKKDLPVIFNTHGGGFYFPLGAEEINNSAYFAKQLRGKGQVLIIPVTDRGFNYPSHREYEDAAWPENANEHAWDLYLPSDDVEYIEYAVPMECKNLKDLPPAYVEVAEMDILREQGLAYAERLKKAGNEVRTKIIKGGYHGYANDQSNAYVKEIIAEHVRQMKTMMAGVYVSE